MPGASGSARGHRAVRDADQLVTLRALDRCTGILRAAEVAREIALKQRMVLETDASPASGSRRDQLDRTRRWIRDTKHPGAGHRPQPKAGLCPHVRHGVDRPGGPQRLFTLPQPSVSYNPYGDTVFVGGGTKGPDGKALLLAQQKVRHDGRHARDQVAILSASRKAIRWSPPADQVAHGMPVIVNNSISRRTTRPPAKTSERERKWEFTDIFIERPVLATVVSLTIFVLGLRSIGLLPVLHTAHAEPVVTGPPSTSGRTRRSSRGSLPHRSKIPSPRRTASTT